ncbi:MAG: tryptophan synthase subunit alpha [Planctomycetes bacterium]|nr:tryptophan synthase subunit alpha [Planctomycetota bacterium]
MKTYKDIFADKSRTALIPFFVLGDPDMDTSLEIVKTAIDSGADILELGIPFSDPIADGPTIQKADIRALNLGMNCHKAFELIRRIKAYKDIPIGLLMYYNLIWHYGVDAFYQDAAQAGVNSVLIADLSIDDADEILPVTKQAGMDTVFMVTPITTPQRKQRIADKTTGFIYTVSLLGVTGTRNQLSGDVGGLVREIKGITDLPVCVGFGVSSPEHARTIAQAGADGVIIGSKIVGLIEANLDNRQNMLKAVGQFITSVRAALD